MNSPRQQLRDAIRDQLTDIRCAIRDGDPSGDQLAYANECIARCFELLALEELGDRGLTARTTRIATAIAKVLAK